MKKFSILFLLIIIYIFPKCSLDKGESPDKIPPSKVYLTPHLCDPGDAGCIYTDLNNGIDPVPTNLVYNWMKIQWDGTELAMDGDIDYIDVYRFHDEDTIKQFVDQMTYHPDTTKFIDKFGGYQGPVTQRTWSYYIIPFDEAGNSTNSDTVSFRLIEKPGLQSPSNDSYYANTDTIDFSWSGPASYTYRILFFDLSNDLQFSKDMTPAETSCTAPEMFAGSGFYPISGQSYIWRVDAFEILNEDDGSESEERVIHFTQKSE